MTTLVEVLALTSQMQASESYTDLLQSRAHWLFELTIELLTAPVAFAAGWLWRNGVLRHLHRDLHSLQHARPRECVEQTGEPRLPRRRSALRRRGGRASLTGGPPGSDSATAADDDALSATGPD